MALALGAGELLGAGSATARLSAGDSFSFSSSSYKVAEAAGSAEITILRSGPATGEAGVHFATADGTAKAGSDYSAVSADVHFAPGETSKPVQIPIVNDSIGEGDETVGLSLSSPSGGVLGTPSSATLQIIDDDRGFAFAYASFYAAESDGTTYVTIRRLGLTTGSDSVYFATADGTAKAGSDYTAVSQTVTFGDGQSSQNVPIPIADDTLVEGNKTIQLSLSNPSAGTSLSDPSATTLTIFDDDKPPAAPAKPSGKIFSARVTKTSLGSSEAGLVRVAYSLYPESRLFAYVLSFRSGSTWTIVRTVRKTGSFAGPYTLTIKQLFGSKPISSGSYRLELSADKNSKTLRFRVI
jgi:hypothetical protein